MSRLCPWHKLTPCAYVICHLGSLIFSGIRIVIEANGWREHSTLRSIKKKKITHTTRLVSSSSVIRCCSRLSRQSISTLFFSFFPPSLVVYPHPVPLFWVLPAVALNILPSGSLFRIRIGLWALSLPYIKLPLPLLSLFFSLFAMVL